MTDGYVLLASILATVASFAESGWMLTLVLMLLAGLCAAAFVMASGIVGADMEAMHEREKMR